MSKFNSVPEILLVEDNPGDVRLIIEAFKDSEIPINLHVATDGEMAMQMLYQENRPKPNLILLDFNLPKINGKDILIELKETPDLASISVIILTSIMTDELIKNYKNYADSIFIKPGDLNKYIQIIETIRDTWLKEVQIIN